MTQVKTSITVLFLVLSLTVFSKNKRAKRIKGTGVTKQKTISYVDFNKLSFLADMRVNVVQSDKYQIVVSYDEIYKDKLEVNKEEKTVIFDVKGNNKYKKARLEIKVYTPFIEKVKTEGNTQLTLTYFRTPNVEFDLDGITTVYSTLDVAKKLKIKSKGSLIFFLEGSASDIEMKSEGSLDFKAKKFKINNNSVIESEGNSKIEIKSNSKILLTSSGSVSINNYGEGELKVVGVTGAFKYRSITD